MKKAMCIILSMLLLCGCTNNHEMDTAMSFREKLQSGAGCSFEAYITADYIEKIYVFTLDCEIDKDGNMTFTVKDPESIAGITGKIFEDRGELIFEDRVLAFETMADDLITPVSAPWLAMRTLKGGYLKSCGLDEESIKIVLDDSYQKEALRVEAWMSKEGIPENFDIMWKGYRILQIVIKEFRFL